MCMSLIDLHNQLNLGLKKNEKGTDKEYPKKYLSLVYQDNFEPWQKLPIRFLEIGIRGGSSIKLWSDYFDEIELFGIDNGEEVEWQALSKLHGKNVRFIRGDAYSDEIIKSLPNDFDVIIDDGPHTLESQIYTVQNYSKKLKPGGLLFIEDIQGSYVWRDKLLNSLPSTFRGCARTYDLRRVTDEGDAFILLLHNCGEFCDKQFKVRNNLSHLNYISRQLKISEIRYRFSRFIKLIKFKFFCRKT